MKENQRAAEFNLGIVLRPLAYYVREHHGEDRLRTLADEAGVALSDLDGQTRWGSFEQCEQFLAEVYDLVGRDDSLFVDVCCYKFAKSLGPVRHMVRARTPRFIFERVVNEFSFLSKVSRQELVEISDHACTIRYRTEKPESRLMCYSRQSSIAAVPSIWGLPKARLTETKCVAQGDEYCEYHLNWFRPHRYTMALLGGACGLASVSIGYALQPLAVPYLSAIVVALPLLGHLVDVRRINRSNLEFSDKMTEDTRALLHADAEARQEIMELNERQREWDRVMSSRSADAQTERTALLSRLGGLQSRMASNVRGFGHDINTPLAVLKTHSRVLQKRRAEITDSEIEEIFQANDEAMDNINGLVDALMKMAKSHNSIKAVVPEEIDVADFASQLHRRARALVHGQNIAVVIQVQGLAPERITTDRLMLDRITDNLLINASKYTDAGTIRINVDAQGGDLSLEIQDTGRGIASEDLSKIFEPEGSDVASRKAGSFGLGLSVVVELLALLGGRMYVTSKPSEGSLFRVVLPLAYLPPIDKDEEPPEPVVSY